MQKGTTVLLNIFFQPNHLTLGLLIMDKKNNIQSILVQQTVTHLK